MKPTRLISRISAVAAAAALSLTLSTGVSADNTVPEIVKRVTDTTSTVVVELPDALLDRLKTGDEVRQGEEARPARQTSGKSVGYRVQIYSDNNQRTARAEAERRAAAIRSHFPEYQAYVVFQSPYWRVRVGDFRSRSQAEDAAAQMKHVLPVYGKEMRVVKDRVNL